jgi:predicted transcriptional regulator
MFGGATADLVLINQHPIRYSTRIRRQHMLIVPMSSCSVPVMAREQFCCLSPVGAI